MSALQGDARPLTVAGVAVQAGFQPLLLAAQGRHFGAQLLRGGQTALLTGQQPGLA